jgi:Holliday junction resolvasome RuvABC endonuclease subunit
MNQTDFRILAIAPSTRGFGFVVIEGERDLIAWGGRVARGDKNAQSLAKVEKLMGLYRPSVVVLQDAAGKDSRRALRIKTLNQQIIAAAGKRKVKVALLTGKQLRTLLLGNAAGTKQEMAETVAKCFPERLASRPPRKRRPWMNEDGRMDVFDAAALAVAFRVRKRGWRASGTRTTSGPAVGASATT